MLSFEIQALFASLEIASFHTTQANPLQGDELAGQAEPKVAEFCRRPAHSTRALFAKVAPNLANPNTSSSYHFHTDAA